MRSVIQPQLKFGETDIAAIALDPKSRDDIPQLLRGLQYIYTEIDLRQRVFAILEEVMPARADGKGKASRQTGRPGMEQWKILVLGVLRLGLNVDYDRMQELANQHKTIRQMLGHSDWLDEQEYELQTIRDNVSLFTPEILDRINQEVIKAGHSLLKKRRRTAEIHVQRAHAERQIDQIRRRVLQGETIPHGEKVFSIFQPHTEWISKGKAGVPVELGLRVAVVEDQHRFILHHQVMVKTTDDQIAVALVEHTQTRFPAVKAMSFDKGFHSPGNQTELKQRLENVILPKKGRLSEADKARESAPGFVRLRRQHSAVESAINALGVHGLDKCPDHGIAGFKRYVALAIVARNIQRQGAVLREQEQQEAARRRGPYKKAA
jgi:IS5 family transposase